MINQVGNFKTCEEIITHSGTAKLAGYLYLSKVNSSNILLKWIMKAENWLTKTEKVKMLKENSKLEMRGIIEAITRKGGMTERETK